MIYTIGVDYFVKLQYNDKQHTSKWSSPSYSVVTDNVFGSKVHTDFPKECA